MIRIAAFGWAALVTLMPLHLHAQDSLTAARQLYGSAHFDRALRMLDGLLARGPSLGDRRSIEFYRVLCLVALDNEAEASRAIEEMVVRDPLHSPPTDDIPPRLRPTFSSVRRRLLPQVILDDYDAARAAFDREDRAAAAEGFAKVLTALSDPEIAQLVERPPLSDLKIMATGFRDLLALLAKAMAQEPPASRGPEPPVNVPPVDAAPSVNAAPPVNTAPQVR
jgi:hypothetical protein